MNLTDAGDLIGKRGTTIARMENGEIESIRPHDVQALCTGYGADDATVTRMVELARESRKLRAWWEQYDGSLPPWFEGYLELEGEAGRIEMWHPTLVPGLLQTRDYAHAVVTSSGLITDPAEIEESIEVRMTRQMILKRTEPAAPHLWVVMDEGVLYRVIGNADIQRKQLEHLVTAGERPNVTVQVMPYRAGGHAALVGGPMILVEFTDQTEPGVVYIENFTGGLVLDQPEDTARYARLLNHLRASAASPAESRSLIVATAANL
jgi:hypothetical protein